MSPAPVRGLLAGALALSLLAGCATAPAPVVAPAASTPADAPRAFRGRTVSGAPLDLGAHLGRDVVLLAFWATYCEPCEAEAPFLQALHEIYGPLGLQVVGVSIDGPDTSALVAPFIAARGLTYPIVADPDGRLARAWGTDGSAPYTILVNRRGTEVARGPGFDLGRAGVLEARIRRLVQAP